MRRRDFTAGLAFAALMRGARGVRPFSSLHDEQRKIRVAFLGADIVGVGPQFFSLGLQLIALFIHGRLMEFQSR